jgi:shikimate kinase
MVLSTFLPSVLGPVSPETKIGLCVSFVGLPSVGKSSLAREYSLQRNLVFVDSDALVEESMGLSVSKIFADLGELAFRDSEERVIDEVSLRASYVLATGGGSILRAATRVRLKTRSLVVYLHSSVEAVASRLGGELTRPLLSGSDRFEKLHMLYMQRDALYRETAHSIIECSDLCIEDILPLIDRAVTSYTAGLSSSG